MNAPDPIAAIRRGDVALRWVPIAGTDLEVMTDALRVEGVRAPVSARTAQRIADLLTVQDPEGHAISLPTPAVVDLAFAQARLRPPPMTLWAPGRNIAEYRWAVEHSRRLDVWLLQQGSSPELLVAPVGKDWVLTDRITARRACNYGWHRVGAPPIQPVSYRHGPDHHDYSQTLRLVRVPPGADFPGRGRITRQPGVDPTAPAITDERPLAWRAAVRELRDDAEQGRRGAWLPIDTVRAGAAHPEPGDLAIYSRGNPGSGLGHVDRVVAADATGALTVGANEQRGRWVIERVEYGDRTLMRFVRG